MRDAGQRRRQPRVRACALQPRRRPLGGDRTVERKAGGRGDCFATGRGRRRFRCRRRSAPDPSSCRSNTQRSNGTRLRLRCAIREVAAWVPLPDARWQLAWTLAEIADERVFEPSQEGWLTTIVGETRPSDVSVRLRELVTLEVNEAGSVEFAILNGTDATREHVPDVAERREREDELQRRRAADQKVNWKRRRDPGRAPSFAYTDSQACGGDPWLLRLVGRARRIDCHPRRPVLPGADPIAAELRPGRLAGRRSKSWSTCSNRGQRGWSACSDVTTTGARTSISRPGGRSAGRCASTCSPAGARDSAARPVPGHDPDRRR